jgi:hypothetical protein
VHVDKLAPNANMNSISRSLEAYLLLLLGFVLFNNAHGDIVDKVLLPYTHAIMDADANHISFLGSDLPFLVHGVSEVGYEL